MRATMQYALLTALLFLPCLHADVKSITVDYQSQVGNYSNFVHGFDNGPLCSTGANYSSAIRYVGGTHVRNHDMGVLDYCTYFPNFAADPEDPASYNFTLGDVAFANIINSGLSIYFRLGNSWDNPTWSKLPDNITKFARVAVRALQHYNEGTFAGGFTGNAIKRVEIWNEPDEPRFWNGTAAYLYQLYDATARAIKAYDPSIAVGGPAVALLSDTNYSSSFLAAVGPKGYNSPLDFFSWHHYGWPWASNASQYADQASQARQMLTAAGFGPEVESHLTEWNIGVLTDVADSAQAATFVASALTYMQSPDSRVDLAIFYPGCNSENPPAPTNVTTGWGLWSDSASQPAAAPGWRRMSYAYWAVGYTMKYFPAALSFSQSAVERDYTVLAARSTNQQPIELDIDHGQMVASASPQGTSWPVGVSPDPPPAAVISIVISAETSVTSGFALNVTGLPAGSNWGILIQMINSTSTCDPSWSGDVAADGNGVLSIPPQQLDYPAVAWVLISPQA